MSDFNAMVEHSHRINGDLPTQVPFHVNASGARAITTGTKYDGYGLEVQSYSSFIDAVKHFTDEMGEGEKTVISVQQHRALARFRFPMFGNQSIELNRILTEEAQAWLKKVETITGPKALAEFIEDYGEWLKAPDDYFQPNQLDLVSALTKIRVSNKTAGTIEYRPHGDRVEFSVSRDAQSSTTYELPILLYASPQLHVGDNKAYRIKVRINYSVDESNTVHVRCRVANRDSLFVKATEDLAESLDLDLDDDRILVIL